MPQRACVAVAGGVMAHSRKGTAELAAVVTEEHSGQGNVTVRQESEPITAEPGLNKPGVFAELGTLPAGALITEHALARILGKCTASIKAAVARGELPRPTRLGGKRIWTAGAIVRHIEKRLEAAERAFGQGRA